MTIQKDQKAKIDNLGLHLLFVFINFFGLCSAVGGLVLFGYQVWFYLKYALWKSYSFYWAIKETGLSLPEKFDNWLAQPNEWLGVHKIVSLLLELSLAILNFLPLSLVLTVMGIIILSMVPKKYKFE